MSMHKVALDHIEQPRLLVCDDERHIVRLLQVNFERQGYRVDCACDGREAIALLENSELLYDKVVLDAEIPLVDAYEVLTWIRTHDRMRGAWVAIMLPSAQDREVWEQRSHRADLYLTKPFNPADM